MGRCLKKNFFIVFEGIEGSGKSYQSKKLYNNIKKRKLPVILTREPGGTIGAERIRNIILKGLFFIIILKKNFTNIQTPCYIWLQEMNTFKIK